MADPVLVRAHVSHDRLSWSFVDEAMVAKVELVEEPNPGETIAEGDVWQVQLVNAARRRTKAQVAQVRLIARIRTAAPWQEVTTLTGHWTEARTLQALKSLLHGGRNVLLVGEAGVGKTTLCYRLCETLGWQAPCKVDVGSLRHGTELLGSDAAVEGATGSVTRFVRSAFARYVERAVTAHELGLTDRFLVILDELNRAHQKSLQILQGLLDDTRQVTITTTEGSTTLILPPNLHVIGTMNLGDEYQVFAIDNALRSRFAPIQVRPMPLDYEVAKLVAEVGILERQALEIVKVGRELREAKRGGALSYAPTYRECVNTAILVRDGMGLKDAMVLGFLPWYGELEFDERHAFVEPSGSTELGKAYAALTKRGVTNGQRTKDAVRSAVS